MKYVTRVLQAGETVVFTTHLHWLIFLRAIVVSLICVALLIGSATISSVLASNAFEVVAEIFALIALAFLAARWQSAALRPSSP
jgi:hypothetical protein